MYSFLPSSATRAEPLDWTRLLSCTLAVVKAVPTEQVSNAVAMMYSYATASPTVFTSLTRGARDVKEYVALLTALDDVLSQWPLRLRQLFALPPVALVSAGGGVNGSLVTVPVSTPRGEALVFLLNVAVGHLESGLDYLARVRADTAAATSVSTPQGGSVAAPNQNAKIAAQHFRQAVEVLRWSEALHAAPASPSAVTLQQLRTQLPLEVTQGMALLCVAVAKYMYALSSASTKNKPDVLAKLAFEAAQLPLPTSVLSTSSLQLLPSLLLAAYHYHEATWYYAHASAKGPEMAEALGHVRYADTLLRTCDGQWSLEEVHKEAEYESRQWWGRRLASLFSGASAGNAVRYLRTAQPQRPQLNLERAEDAGDDDSGAASPLKPATQYPHLHALLFGETATPAKADAETKTRESAVAPADVVQVYPYVRLLLSDVCAVLQQYEKENRVVYFAKVASADEVRRDVPDVASTGPNAGETQASEESVFESRTRLFASLPPPASLQAALAVQEEVGQAQQALSRALQRVEKDGQQLAAYVTTTAALEQAVDALEALLPKADGWASPKAVVAIAVDAVEAAFETFKKVAAEWQEAHDVYVGERCVPPASAAEAEREVVAWTERATSALAQWASLRLPPTVDSRTAFVEALVPRSAEMWAFLEQVEGLSRDVRDVLAAEPGVVTQAQVQSAVEALEKVKLRGTELMAAAAVEGSRARSRPSASAAVERGNGAEAEALLRVAPQYERAEAAVLALVDVLQEAPMVVADMEHFTAQLTEMQRRAVVRPLGRASGVQFHPHPDDRSGTGVVAGSAVSAGDGGRRDGEAASASNAKPNKRRVAGVTAATAAKSASSKPTSSSRKRSRKDSSPSASSADGSIEDESDFGSVSSSQLEDTAEVEPTPADGATRAAVSGSLLSRMKANKAKRQAEPSGAAAVDAAQPVSPPRSRKGASPAVTAKKATKNERSGPKGRGGRRKL
ncbi:hypothetical protein ABB37_08528 [Leptomonas pyrrhocoris]|uniref:BRO1 domain-containing protein n=1 Tax=Leptomonas pyrrhocoris TaxID=157538 RepID=A0A0N0DRV8_LEPPY|nr:hypothetical protein ABB37_08528 [Leptomonas pyrrhocoris]KPA75212.1 hypothetical protein ABB37_08528 [Leptomonas pyrrhocoris]|eukprot:XP_015653651.1 hypothetical protein ABB37_08528 [Leptomonas pyrrhocoris]